MKALLVRVGADQSEWGGWWNGPVDSATGEFVYVPIPDDGPFHPGLATPYSVVAAHLGGRWPSLPANLALRDMHLDPDFHHLTYGDQGQRAVQVMGKVGSGDLLVYYAGLRDIHSSPRLVYAIIGLLVVDAIVPASVVTSNRLHENAHTRRSTPYSGHDIVVRAKPGVSGRCERAIPIGHFASRAYRVVPSVLADWGGLTVRNGYLQRSARLPEFLDAEISGVKLEKEKSARNSRAEHDGSRVTHSSAGWERFWNKSRQIWRDSGQFGNRRGSEEA